MKLWLLCPVEPIPPLWDPWYDKAFGFVVAADTETQAREFAQAESGDESMDHYSFAHTVPAWTDPALSTCKELTSDTVAAGVVLRDFAAA